MASSSLGTLWCLLNRWWLYLSSWQIGRIWQDGSTWINFPRTKSACVQILIYPPGRTMSSNRRRSIWTVWSCKTCTSLGSLLVALVRFCWTFGTISLSAMGGWWALNPALSDSYVIFDSTSILSCGYLLSIILSAIADASDMYLDIFWFFFLELLYIVGLSQRSD